MLKINIFSAWSIALLVTFFALVAPIQAKAQHDFPAKISLFELDILGQLYFISGSELKKYSTEGELLKTYSNLYYGDITYLDVSDPMNLLVYYEDNNIILILDNQLSIKNSPIDLNEMGYGQANLVCLSYGNGFWIYDPITQAIIRFNNFLSQSENSGNLINVTGYPLQPIQLMERDNQVILRDKEYGIFVFDRFANYTKRLPFNNINDLYIRSGLWQMLKNDTIINFNTSTLQLDTMPLIYNNIDEFRMYDKIIYMRLNGKEFIKSKL